MLFRLLAAHALALFSLAGGVAAAHAQAPAQAPNAVAPSPIPSAAPVVAPPPAPSPESFQPSSSPLVAPAPAPLAAQPPAPAPMYPPGYAPYPQPGAYGTYPPAFGDPSPRPAAERRAGMYEHDGLFLRLQVGVGAGGASYKERLVEGMGRARVKTRGFTGTFELALGGRVFDNLIVHGTLIASSSDANKRIDGVEDHTYDDLSTRTVLLGGGATYYVMPANLYLTLSMGAAYFEERRDDDRDDERYRTRIESSAGVGGALTIGKEWWVGRHAQWGIGVAITGTFQATPVEIALEETWAKAHHVSLNFSATYN